MANVQFPVNPDIGDDFTSPDGIIYIWDGEKWSTTLGPTQSGATGATGLGSTGATGADGPFGATGATGPATEAVPTGVVTMWYGASNTIPSGWVMCDGTNGTPDLRDRFVIGAGSSYSLSDTGGSKDAVVVSHSHSTASHSHSFSGSSNFSGNTGNPSSNHTHQWGANTFGVQNGGSAAVLDNPQSDGGGSKRTNTSGQSTNHTHPFSGSVSVSGNTGGNTVTVNSEGVSSTNKNLPPYYALFYIMKN